MSSCFSRSKVSAPLVTGQTSISSSLESMDSLLDQGQEPRIDDGAYRQVPAALVGYAFAFYRVLLRHQDGDRTGEGDIARGVDVVVGKRMTGGGNALRGDHVEKSLRIADPRYRVHFPVL